MRLLVVLALASVLTACASGGSRGQVTSTPSYPRCGASELSARDNDGTLIGSTADSTTIRVAAPSHVPAMVETTLRVRMTGVSPLNTYAEQPSGPIQAWGRFPRVDPTAIEAVAQDTWTVRLTFPWQGCWRLQTERAGGKVTGHVWLDVLPRT